MSTMVKANGDRVLVKVKREELVTKSGIILAPKQEERYYEGEVINVGDNPVIKQYDVNVGDYVFYSKGTNSEIIVDDILYDLVSVFDILAKGEK